jgi:galactokinase
MSLPALKTQFGEAFTPEGEIDYFFCPGRVNLIGEHIDYNGGYVFPAALTLGIYAAVRYNGSRTVRLRSLNAAGEEAEFELDEEIRFDLQYRWANYPKGMFKYLLEKGEKPPGCDILFYGDLPEEAGLSSSAAIEVLTGYLLLHYSHRDNIDRVELARLSKRVENEFIGVNSGIMDQFSVAMGKKDNAILLDCSLLSYRYIPFKLEEHTLIIMNTFTRRELASSKYNERRDECDRALAILKQHENVENLCSASLESAEKYLKDDALLKRTRHAITENARVLKAVEALEKKDITLFGKLMTESHESLKNDYEVTGFNLDVIVEEALSAEGCIGARMTGAGFGGCAIALVENDSVKQFKAQAADMYLKRTGLQSAFYDSTIGEGVHKVNQFL